MKFRSDINGLRAIAVLAVVFYHFELPVFNGGFVGVDIFFVISGFLMTGIIFNKLENSEFILSEFYYNRGKRILPPLIVVCSVLLLLGWFYLPSEDYKYLGRHVASSVSFLSNYTYLSEAGYFDSGSKEKWLLHTWSLSAEWQFYILYPLFIMGIAKLASGIKVRIYVLILTVLSFLLCVFLSNYAPSSTFFGLHTRAWEMLAGGLAYFYTVSLTRNMSITLNALGLVGIFISILFIDSSMLWPSTYTLLPVVSTMLMIMANPKNSWVTGNSISQWFGNISYSLYLWHWPVVVLLVYLGLSQLLFWKLFGVAISVFMAFLSYRLIESNKKLIPSWDEGRSRKLLNISLLVFMLGIVVSSLKGLPVRLPKEVLNAEVEALNKNPYRKNCTIQSGLDHPFCIIGSADDNVVGIVIGDSHADALFTAVLETLPVTGSLLFLAYDSCPTILGVQLLNSPADYRCADFLNKYIALIEKEYRGVPIIVINRTSVYINNQTNLAKRNSEGPLIYFDSPVNVADKYFMAEYAKKYKQTMCKLSSIGPVFITAPIPEMGVNVPKKIARAILLGIDTDVGIDTDLYYERNGPLIEIMNNSVSECDVTLLDPIPYLCKDKKCSARVGGRPIYYDGDHLSEYGNKILVPMFGEIWIN
jgi:peptidoglycan/LPS O-acetylase OafA/YrhL